MSESSPDPSPQPDMSVTLGKNPTAWILCGSLYCYTSHRLSCITKIKTHKRRHIHDICLALRSQCVLPRDFSMQLPLPLTLMSKAVFSSLSISLLLCFLCVEQTPLQITESNGEESFKWIYDIFHLVPKPNASIYPWVLGSLCFRVLAKTYKGSSRGKTEDIFVYLLPIKVNIWENYDCTRKYF